jgi:class 3 adenylate cyclase/predicted ATPase
MECPSCHSIIPDGSKFCAECGQKLSVVSPASATKPPIASTASSPSRTGGTAERRQLTVMFCDLVGSTALSVRLDLEDMREIIGAYHRCCAEQVTKAGGLAAKYMGDGVLAYFGYPQAHEHDAERAVRAALGLIEAVPNLRVGHNTSLQVRVGIATGLVVVGDLVGDGTAQEQGVVGETPNVAARLQALAEPGQVVISNNTRRLTGRLFEYRDLGRVALKGLAENIQAWHVTGISTVRSRFEAQHEASLPPMVGREEELELLMHRWRQAATGEGGVALLTGEPGIGKSRLTVALQERLRDEHHTRLRYFCSPQHTDSALYPIISQIERAAEFERRDAPGARLEKLIALLGRSADHERDVQLLAELLSIPTGDRYPPLDWTSQRKKDETSKALQRHLETLSRQRPVLIIYEDAHWIDPSTRELLDITIERVVRLPVLLVVTFRPEFKPSWTRLAHVTTITLDRLSRRESVGLTERVAGKKVPPNEIVAEIVERSDGIPLFVEELTRAVVEAGGDGDTAARRTVSTSWPPTPVPATLEASLMARLDRLGSVAKRIAQIGAAIGREFSYELLAPVARTSERQLQEALGGISDAGLLSCEGTPPKATFLFKHALVRDAAYGSLLRSQRQQLHARIVATLEALSSDVANQRPEILAQHSAKAELHERAVGYWLKAGQQALARSAMTEAVAQLQKGLALLTSLSESPSRSQQELDLQITLGRALMATRGYSAPAVGETIVRARALAEQLDRPEYLAPLLYSQRAFHVVRGEHKLALSVAEQMEKVGEAQNHEATLLLGRFVHGMSRFYLGELVAARALFERCDGLGNPAHRSVYAALTTHPYAVSLAWLALTLAYLGYHDRARVQMDEALSVARRLGHQHTLVFVLSRICWSKWFAGLPHEAQQPAEEVITLSNEHGFPFWLGWGLLFRGWSLAARGRAQEGLIFLTDGLAAIRDTGTILSTPWALTMLAETNAKLGHTVPGLSHLAEAAQIVEATDERCNEAELHRLRGELLNARGDPTAAEESYHHALAVAQRQSAKAFDLRASASLARLWRDQGKRTEARDLLAPIYGWFSEGFDTPDLKEAEALLEELS